MSGLEYRAHCRYDSDDFVIISQRSDGWELFIQTNDTNVQVHLTDEEVTGLTASLVGRRKDEWFSRDGVTIVTEADNVVFGIASSLGVRGGVVVLRKSDHKDTLIAFLDKGDRWWT